MHVLAKTIWSGRGKCTHHDERGRVSVDVLKRFSWVAECDHVKLLRQKARHVRSQITRIVHEDNRSVLEAEEFCAVDVLVAGAAPGRVARLTHFGGAGCRCRITRDGTGVHHNRVGTCIVPPRRGLVDDGEVASLKFGYCRVLLRGVIDLVDGQVRMASLQAYGKG